MALGWGISLLVIVIWGLYFSWTLKASRSLRLLSLIALAGVLDIVSIYLVVILKKAVALGCWLNLVSWAFLPFFTLLFALYYPTAHSLIRRRWTLPVLVLPSILTLFITDPHTCPDFSQRPNLLWLIIWMTFYFFLAYFLLFRSFRRMRLPIIRHQVFYLSLGLALITGNHLVIDIIMPYFGYDRLWRNNYIVLTVACILVAWGFLRHDIFRWQVRSENRALDMQIESMNEGAGVLAHIMKNHLSVIDYLAAQAEEGRVEKLAEVRRICQDVSTRLDEVGQLPPIESDRGKYFSAEDLAAELGRLELPEGQHMIETHRSPMPYIRGSREQLQAAFTHLIRNASESMTEGGNIQIESQQEGDYIVIRIADQGVGITKERLKNIFRPFSTSKSLYESWGLGLSFAHQVFAAHHGGLIVDSKPGEGTVFIVFLPGHPGPYKIPSDMIEHSTVAKGR